MIEPDNIEQCIRTAAKGRKNRKEVKDVLDNIPYHVNRIRELLLTNTFDMKPHKPKRIVERGKERIIVKPRFKYELIIQHMIMSVLEPVLMKRFYAYSCASIPGRGISYGKKAIERWIKEIRDVHPYFPRIWVYKADIKSFFKNIKRDILKAKLSKLIRDKRFLSVCFKMIDCECVDGLALGYMTSQWFSNFFLTDFDNFVKQILGCKYYIRYMDDIVILSQNREELHHYRRCIEQYLIHRLRLKIKENWQVFQLTDSWLNVKETGRPLDFLGFKFYGYKTTLRKKTLKYTMRTVLRFQKPTNKNCLSYVQGLISRIGWMLQSDVYSYYKHHVRSLVNMSKLKEFVSTYQKEGLNSYEPYLL